MDNRDEPQIGAALDALAPQVGALQERGIRGLIGGMVLGRARRTARRPRLGSAFRRVGLGLTIVVLSIATCSWGVDPSTLTESWGPPIPASNQDAARALTRGAAVLQSAPQSGSLSFTLTEAEATSALSIGLMLPELMRAADGIPVEEIQFDWIGKMVVRAILLGRDYGEISEISVTDGSFTFAARVAD